MLRVRQPQCERPDRVWGYLVTELFFLLAMTSILAVSFHGRPKESLIAVATVAVDIPVYYFAFRRADSTSSHDRSFRFSLGVLFLLFCRGERLLLFGAKMAV